MLLQSRANLVSLTIHDLSVWKKSLIDTCQYCWTSRANQALRSLANADFAKWRTLSASVSFLPLPSHLFHFLALVSFLTWSKPKLPFLSLLCSETKRHCHCCFYSLSSIELWLQLDYLCQIFYIYFRSLILYKRQTNSFHHYDSSTPFNTSAARSLAKNVEPFLLGKLGKRPDLFSVIKKWVFDTCILCRRNWGGGLENGKTT